MAQIKMKLPMEKRNHSTFCRRKSNFVFLVFTLMLLFWAGHAEVVSAFVAPPVVWPDEGTYASRLNVVVSAPGAGIKYTKDETDPCTPSAMDYTRPIELNTLDSSSIILKTCAFVGTEFSSPVAKQYNMIGDRLAKITTENEAYDMMVNAGSDFVAVVQMRSFSSSIGKMDVGLTFDPVKLRLDAIEAVAGFTIPGAIIIDNISGSGFAAIESVGQQDFLGHTSVAILRFHALDQISGSAPISLDTATTVAHDYAQQNEQVLTYWEGLNVTIEGAADITAPTILSIVRHNPTQENVSNGTSATFRITFSEDVANVDISDFVLSGTGASATVQLGGAGTLTPVSASTYDFSLPSAYPGTLSLAVNGPQNIQDLAGNAYVTASPIPTNEQYVVSDTTAPTVTAFSLPAVANSLTVDIVTFAVTDNVGVSQYLITESATVPSVSDGGWNSSVPDSFTFATAGLKTLYAWAKDAAGNVSASKSATVTIDTAAPARSSGTARDASDNPVNTLDAGTTDAWISLDTDETATCKYSDAAGVAYAAMADTFTNTGTYYFAQVTGLTDGTAYHYYVRCMDQYDNVNADDYEIAFTVNSVSDTTAPTVDAFTLDEYSTSRDVPVLAFSASDANGVVGYMITIQGNAPLSYLDPASDPLPVFSPPIPPSASDSGWSVSAPTKYLVASDGIYALCAWAKDASGNITTVANGMCARIVVDTYAPIINTFTLGVSSGYLEVPITELNVTDNAPIAGYMITGNSSAPSASDASWSSWKPTNYQPKSEGMLTLYAWAKDDAGNVSAGRSATALVDITAPTILSIVRHNPTQENVSNGTSATFRITFSEDVANVDISDFVLSGTGASATVQLGGAGTLTPVSASTYDFSLPSAYPGTLSLAVNGPQNIQDLAGNAYVTASPIPTNEQYVVSDTTAPTVTAFSLPAVANSLTVDIVTFAVTDNVGVSQYLITESATVPSVSDGGWNSSVPDSFTFATAGLKTLYAWAKDAAGNVSASKSATVTIDTAAPVIREVSPVPSLTANRRPSYTFNSTEAGTIVYGGDCSSQTTTTAAGNNLIELDSLAAGGSRIYSNCTIQVFDQALNASNVLNMSVFSTDFTPPAISSGFPSGALSVGTVQTTIRVVTSEYAECRYAQFSRNGGFPSSEYFSKSTGMTTENGTDHISVVAGLANGGSYNYYITCFDNLENYNATDYSISFSVANSSTSSGDGGGGSSHKKTTTSPRTISHSKNTVKKGDTLIQRGKKFSKKSPVLLYFGKIGGGYYAPQRVMTSTTGAFSVSYKVNKPAGRYPWYVLDVKTNKKSKIKYYTVR